MKELKKLIDSIEGGDLRATKLAKERQDALAKPPESLGKLETIAIKYAGITGNVKNEIGKRCLIILSADNGVVEEGVSSAPQSVTLAQTINFTRHLTGASALAKNFETQLFIVDMGINATLPKGLVSKDANDFIKDKIIDRKIRYGTSNLANEPAMSREEAIKCIKTGIDMVKTAKENGYGIIGVGEMGIGNTTTSSSILVALTDCQVEDAVGRGGGINDTSFARKKEIVKEMAKEKDFDDVIDILAKVGGFDIAAMVGVFLGGAIYKMPTVVDGYISGVSALAATELNPNVADYLFTSHCSKEPGYIIAMDKIGVDPMLNLDMRLGEGSGCVIAFEIIKAALAVMNDMGTFEEADINDDYLEEIRQGESF